MQPSPPAPPPPSFDTLYIEDRAFLCRAARRRGVAYADIEDVVQDTYLIVHQRLPEFRGTAKPRTWMHAVLNNVCRNYHRSTRRRRRRLLAVAEHWRALESSPTRAGRVELDAYLALDQFLADLAPSRRELFVRVRIEGESAVALARERAVNVNTLRSQLLALERELGEFHCEHDERRTFRQLLYREHDAAPARALPLLAGPSLGWSPRRERARPAWLGFGAAFMSVLGLLAVLDHTRPQRDASEPVELELLAPRRVEFDVVLIPSAPARVRPEPALRTSLATPRPAKRRPKRSVVDADRDRTIDDRPPLDPNITGRSKKIEIDPALERCRFRVGENATVVLTCPSTSAGERYWGELLRSCRATGCPKLSDSVTCFDATAELTYCCSIMYGSFEQISCVGQGEELFTVIGVAELERLVGE